MECSGFGEHHFHAMILAVSPCHHLHMVLQKSPSSRSALVHRVVLLLKIVAFSVSRLHRHPDAVFMKEPHFAESNLAFAGGVFHHHEVLSGNCVLVLVNITSIQWFWLFQRAICAWHCMEITIQKCSLMPSWSFWQRKFTMSCFRRSHFHSIILAVSQSIRTCTVSGVVSAREPPSLSPSSFLLTDSLSVFSFVGTPTP